MTKSEQYRNALIRALRSNKLRAWRRGGRGARIARLAAKLIGSLNRRGMPLKERHYTPAEVGVAWGLSDDTVRRIFDREPGVMRRSRSNPRKRKYVSMRIPESVMLRVHRRLTAML
jgi:hypothetical protein